MSDPKRYLSDAARLRDERRRSLLDELEKLKKEDDEEEKQRERERSRIKELNQDRERSIKMRNNIRNRKSEISAQIKRLRLEDEDLSLQDKKLVDRLDWLNKEIDCIEEGKQYEYPKCLPKLIPKMEGLKEARKKINEKNEIDEDKEKDKIIDEIFAEIRYEKDKDDVESEEEEEEEPEKEKPKEVDLVTQAIKDINEAKDEETKKKIELETNEKLQKLYEEGIEKGDNEVQELAFLRMKRLEKKDAFPITENDFEDKRREEELAEKLKL